MGISALLTYFFEGDIVCVFNNLEDVMLKFKNLVSREDFEEAVAYTRESLKKALALGEPKIKFENLVTREDFERTVAPARELLTKQLKVSF